MVRVWVLAVALSLSLTPIVVLSVEGISGKISLAKNDEESLQRRFLGDGFLSRDIGNIFQPARTTRQSNGRNATMVNVTGADLTNTSLEAAAMDNHTDESNGSSTGSGTSIPLFPFLNGAGAGIPEQIDCGFTFNTSEEGCDQRIASLSKEPGACDCYSFCGQALRGCYMHGESSEFFECFVEDIVIGCKESHRDATDPAVKVPVDTPCPEGYLCSLYGQTDCEVVRLIPKLLGLGDIHAGMYCPGRDNRIDIGYENCDVGYYCPNSTTRIPCPSGYFCPHKTAKPEIICRGCGEGATSLNRMPYTYTIVVLVLAVMLSIIIWQTFDKYNQQRYYELNDLQQRNVDSVQDIAYKRKHLKKLRSLKPKLRDIEKRLRQEYSHRVEDDEELVLLTETPDGKISFDAGKLFDVLDTQRDEELPYRKLNRILKLSHLQLREFVHRMNEIAGETSDEEEVERHVFITQFLRVYGAISHLDPSPEEAANIFDEVAKQGTTKDGEVPLRLFYNSALAEFLNDSQINALLKGFRLIQEFRDNDELGDTEGVKKAKTQCAVVKYAPTVFRRSWLGLPETCCSISRNDFVGHYPRLLSQVTMDQRINSGMLFTSQLNVHKGLDVAFQDVSVSIHAKDRPIKILNGISGRLSPGTMTAIMGGPRSGKTALLDALSGRMCYGDVTGAIHVNGHDTTLEMHRFAVGYVPKIDALYNELTVRETLIFCGKFQLPFGTPQEEIEDLADAIMASFDLSRVMHADIGKPHHGGLSQFERKGVSIASELMSRPRILFLESPTSGLDPGAALRIVRDLKRFVDVQGITVCASLSEARRDVFEIFDSVLLLGCSGKLVYLGPVRKIGKYFNQLNYILPDGESVTDWMLDIATGRLPPPFKQRRQVKPSIPSSSGDTMPETISADELSNEEKRQHKKVKFAMTSRTPSGTDERDNLSSSRTKPFDIATEQAKATCELLHDNWIKHVNELPKKKRVKYDPPSPSGLPREKEKPPFIDQLFHQLRRLLILKERNWLVAFRDTTIIIVTVILVSLMNGAAEPTKDVDMQDLNYERVAEPSSVESLLLEFPKLFSYAITGVKDDIEMFATMVGVLFAVVVSLLATKLFLVKKNQFFREAASGYNVGAFFLATNIVGTIEHAVQAVLSAMFAYSIRNSLSAWYSYVLHFLLLSWVSASWGIFFSFVIPSKHVSFVTGFLVAFFALLFCGAIPPIGFEVIYDGAPALVASGFLSPTRFFVESMAVAEGRCLPVQSGFTELSQTSSEIVHISLTFHRTALQYNVSSFQILHYGTNDFGEIIQQSCNGWYWGALPCLMVGLVVRWLALGAIYGTNRSNQCKRSIRHALNNETGAQRWFFAYTLTLASLLAAAMYFILKPDSWTPPSL